MARRRVVVLCGIGVRCLECLLSAPGAASPVDPALRRSPCPAVFWPLVAPSVAVFARDGLAPSSLRSPLSAAPASRPVGPLPGPRVLAPSLPRSLAARLVRSSCPVPPVLPPAGPGGSPRPLPGSRPRPPAGLPFPRPLARGPAPRCLRSVPPRGFCPPSPPCLRIVSPFFNAFFFFWCAPVPCCGTHSVCGFGRPWRLPWPCVVAACGLLLCCPAVPSVPRPVPCRAGFLFACPARVALVVAPFLLELWVPSRRGSQGIWVPRPAGLAPRCPPSGLPPDAFPTQPLLAACPHSPLALRRRPACVPAALGGFVAGGRCPCRVALPCSGLARLPCPWLSAWLPVARLALRGACLPGVPAGPASPVPGPGARSPLVGVGLACLVVSSVALVCSVLRPCF